MSLNVTKKRQGGNVQETKVITFADQTLIRGKDNTQTVPVKVDEQGRLVLAADLNIDVGEISIGAVEQGKRSEAAEPWEVTLTGSTAKSTTHHDEATSAGDGTDADVSGYSNLGVFITGTATSHQVDFQGSIDGTNFFPVEGVNYATSLLATSTNGIDEAWFFDVRGLKLFRAKLTSVSGGNVTVVSEATI